MADDLGATGEMTFRPGGALDKISQLARKWERRALNAEKTRRARRLERAAWAFAGALGALSMQYFRHR